MFTTSDAGVVFFYVLLTEFKDLVTHILGSHPLNIYLFCFSLP